MRIVRGAKALSDYCESIGCPISESTIYRLIRFRSIPFKRPSPGVLIFHLDAIDEWLSGDDSKKEAF